MKISAIVLGRAGKQTVRVRLDRTFRHPKFEKVIHRTRELLVHDERGEAAIGDRVTIVFGRPRSRRKRWVLQPTSD